MKMFYSDTKDVQFFASVGGSALSIVNSSALLLENITIQVSFVFVFWYFSFLASKTQNN